MVCGNVVKMLPPKVYLMSNQIQKKKYTLALVVKMLGRTIKILKKNAIAKLAEGIA